MTPARTVISDAMHASGEAHGDTPTFPDYHADAILSALSRANFCLVPRALVEEAAGELDSYQRCDGYDGVGPVDVTHLATRLRECLGNEKETT